MSESNVRHGKAVLICDVCYVVCHACVGHYDNLGNHYSLLNTEQI